MSAEDPSSGKEARGARRTVVVGATQAADVVVAAAADVQASSVDEETAEGWAAADDETAADEAGADEAGEEDATTEEATADDAAAADDEAGRTLHVDPSDRLRMATVPGSWRPWTSRARSSGLALAAAGSAEAGARLRPKRRWWWAAADRPLACGLAEAAGASVARARSETSEVWRSMAGGGLGDREGGGGEEGDGFGWLG